MAPLLHRAAIKTSSLYNCFAECFIHCRIVYYERFFCDKLCVVTTSDHAPLLNTQASDELPEFMNGPVRNVLGIIPPEVTWQTSKLPVELLTFS